MKDLRPMQCIRPIASVLERILDNEVKTLENDPWIESTFFFFWDDICGMVSLEIARAHLSDPDRRKKFMDSCQGHGNFVGSAALGNENGQPVISFRNYVDPAAGNVAAMTDCFDKFLSGQMEKLEFKD
jgi:hypothetical protein